MTLKGATTTQACAACKYQRKRCTPECVLAPYFRPEHPLVFKNAHKLFGVRNILRILKQVNPLDKSEAIQSITYEANMRGQFPVHGCLTVICDLRFKIMQAEEELSSILTQLAFYKQHHERLEMTTWSPVVSRNLLQFGMTAIQCGNPLFRQNVTTNVGLNSLWLQETKNHAGNDDYKLSVSQPSSIEEDVVHDHDEINPFLANIED